MWVCGLKLIAYSVWWDIFVVAPYVGVWIETRKIYNARNRKESHPMWVCGLKRGNEVRYRLRQGRTLWGGVD